MSTASPLAALPHAEVISLRILTLRGQRLIVDAELAHLYDVPTKRLNEAVKRNLAKSRPTSCSPSPTRSSPT